MISEREKKELEILALKIRIGVLEQMTARGFGHVGGSLSAADLLAVLYGKVMRYDPQNPGWEERDKFVCSKGHSGPVVYAALALMGFFPYEQLKTLNRPGTILPSHCDHLKTPGIDVTTGSLGQGSSLALGMALGDKLKGRGSKTYLLLGDGEINEGQVWEAAMFAAAKDVTNITFLIDWNKRQLDGAVDDILKPFDIEEKFRAFGFDAVTVNGHDVEQLTEALERPADGKPKAIVLDTIKGKGLTQLETNPGNHSLTLPEETWAEYLAELKGRLAAAEKEGA